MFVNISLFFVAVVLSLVGLWVSLGFVRKDNAGQLPSRRFAFKVVRMLLFSPPLVSGFLFLIGFILGLDHNLMTVVVIAAAFAAVFILHYSFEQAASPYRRPL